MNDVFCHIQVIKMNYFSPSNLGLSLWKFDKDKNGKNPRSAKIIILFLLLFRLSGKSPYTIKMVCHLVLMIRSPRQNFF